MLGMKNFISHMVQIILGSVKEDNPASSAFISHMVQIILAVLSIILLKFVHRPFISHMVQIILELLELKEDAGISALYPTWFR